MCIFEINTVIFSNLITSLIMIVIMTRLLIHNKNRFPGTIFWLLSYIFNTAALSLLFFKEKFPYPLSMLLANLMLVVSFVLFYVGLERFTGKKGFRAFNIIMAVIFFILYIFFGIVKPSRVASSIVFSLAVMVVTFQCMLYLFVVPDRKHRSVYRTTGIVFLFWSILYLINFISYVIPQTGGILTSSGNIESMVAIVDHMLGISLAFSLIMMINGRLYLDIQQYNDEKELMVQELRRLVNTDGLTGIFNRTKIEQVLTIEVLRSRRYRHPLSIIMADVDHFKNVNDTYGHAVGDVVLMGIASLMRQHIREVDTVGRWGGEEFLIVCPDTTIEGACKVAEKLRKRIEKHNFKDAGIKTLSMGVAQLNDDEWDDEMLKRADKALYRAKRLGRNRVEWA